MYHLVYWQSIDFSVMRSLNTCLIIAPVSSKVTEQSLAILFIFMNPIYRVNSINDCIMLSHTQCIIIIPCPDKKSSSTYTLNLGTCIAAQRMQCTSNNLVFDTSNYNFWQFYKNIILFGPHKNQGSLPMRFHMSINPEINAGHGPTVPNSSTYHSQVRSMVHY